MVINKDIKLFQLQFIFTKLTNTVECFHLPSEYLAGKEHTV